MHDVGKIILVLGVLLVISGGIILLFGNLFSWFGNLPGDIHIKRGNFQLFFPLTSMVLVSAFLSFVFWLIRRFF